MNANKTTPKTMEVNDDISVWDLSEVTGSNEGSQKYNINTWDLSEVTALYAGCRKGKGSYTLCVVENAEK